MQYGDKCALRYSVLMVCCLDVTSAATGKHKNPLDLVASRVVLEGVCIHFNYQMEGGYY